MASKKTATLQYNDWPGGGWHSVPYSQHLQNQRAAAGNPLTLPVPPPGNYDSSIDYSSGAAKRGYQEFGDDAQTQYEQGQEDYQNNKNLLGLNVNRLNADYGTQTADLGHQYGILGHQQAEHAAQAGVTSAGLLAKSAAVRGANQAHDQTAIDLSHTRGLEDINNQRQQLDLQNARVFGGFNGSIFEDPYTHQPVAGSLLTSLQRAGIENNAYQGGLDQQKISQAQANGYISPLLGLQGTGSSAIGRTPLTKQQWQQGLFLDALLGGRPR